MFWTPPLMNYCFELHLLNVNIVDPICRERMLWTPSLMYDVLHLSRVNAVDAFFHG